jgi:hypothetical protein
MTEAEFDRLLDAVRTAVTPVPEEDFMLAHLPICEAPPIAANDNRIENDNGLESDKEVVWPLIPFPDGWCATN